ncbi:MAG: hypothetical protein H0W58_13180 [Acidobacteria bacterium]|nr:hypothetical protein [Acidobacteriota bacterium]
MKRFVFFFVLFSFPALSGYAQKIVKIEKPTQPALEVNQFSTEISEKEWQIIIDSLQAEDWEKSAFLAGQLINRVKTDNEKKRLARLRYIYLYALAGKIIAFSEANKKSEEAAAREELRKAADSFVGKEFVLPPRRFLANCNQVLNYICPVKNNDNALRVTATNKEGTAIHSFELILFDQKVDLKDFTGKETFLGGILAKVEFNENKSYPWIMRLSFVRGFIRVIVTK